jgi:hypothetical protein
MRFSTFSTGLPESCPFLGTGVCCFEYYPAGAGQVYEGVAASTRGAFGGCDVGRTCQLPVFLPGSWGFPASHILALAMTTTANGLPRHVHRELAL